MTRIANATPEIIAKELATVIIHRYSTETDLSPRSLHAVIEVEVLHVLKQIDVWLDDKLKVRLRDVTATSKATPD